MRQWSPSRDAATDVNPQPSETVKEADATRLRERRREFAARLADVVTGNAPAGFLLPLDRAAHGRFCDLGRVPGYARDPDRTLADGVFFWKRLAKAA